MLIVCSASSRLCNTYSDLANGSIILTLRSVSKAIHNFLSKEKSICLTLPRCSKKKSRQYVLYSSIYTLETLGASSTLLLLRPDFSLNIMLDRSSICCVFLSSSTTRLVPSISSFIAFDGDYSRNGVKVFLRLLSSLDSMLCY